MEELIKNYCSRCRQITKHITLFSKKIRSEPGDEFGWTEYYKVVECAGCSNISFRKEYSDESMVGFTEEGQEFSYEDITNYPLHLKNHVPLSHTFYLPHNIKIVYHETIESFKAKSYLLTAVGFRTMIEAICIDEDIKGNSLEQKIKNLAKNKLITEKEEGRLHSIRFLGNDSVHEMMVPSERKLFTVLEIVEHLLRNIYLIDKISKSQLDTVINTYESFAELLWMKVKSIDQSDEKSLKEILGKDVRRVGDNLNLLEQKLIEAINKGTTNFLSLGKIIPGDKPIQYYNMLPKQEDDF